MTFDLDGGSCVVNLAQLILPVHESPEIICLGIQKGLIPIHYNQCVFSQHLACWLLLHIDLPFVQSLALNNHCLLSLVSSAAGIDLVGWSVARTDNVCGVGLIQDQLCGPPWKWMHPTSLTTEQCWIIACGVLPEWSLDARDAQATVVIESDSVYGFQNGSDRSPSPPYWIMDESNSGSTMSVSWREIVKAHFLFALLSPTKPVSYLQSDWQQ